jgi:cardiolipin synthase (CMP-forming)
MKTVWYKNIIWNVPNILSAYRLGMFPIILGLVYFKLEQAFIVLYIINLITDIADGYIARKFDMQTEAGAVLDSMADVGSYIIAVFGILQFHYYLFTDYGYWLSAFVVLYLLTLLVPMLKYGRPTAGLHLYSNKIAGYVQGIFLAILFGFKMVPVLFYAAMIIGYVAELEGIIINLHAKTPHLNAKTIYHYFKKRTS